jgi:hypothetical protein
VEGVLDQVIGWLVEKGKALLKAIGLGGDEKDKDKKPGADKQIGKTVSFTADDHSHKLWIEAHGESAEVMVASGVPMPVEKKLSVWESNLDQAGERKAEAKSTIAKARQTLVAAKTDVEAETEQKKKIKSKPEDTAASAAFDKAEQKTEAEEDTLGGLLTTLFEIFREAGSVLALLGEKLVKRGDAEDTAFKTVKRITLPPDGYSMPDRDGTIHIQRQKAEGFPEVHLEPDGRLADGPGKSKSATDEEKIAVYNGILKAVSKKKYKDEDDVDNYRRRMVMDVVAAAGDLATLDAEVLNSTTLIPPAYNRVRGEIFERWVEVNMGAIGPGPVFASKSLGKDRVRLIADFTTADGASLVEAKALTVVRPPQAEEVEQMAAYGKVLGKVKGFTTATGVGKIYYRIVYVFNKPELPAKWKGALDDNLKGKYSTLP